MDFKKLKKFSKRIKKRDILCQVLPYIIKLTVTIETTLDVTKIYYWYEFVNIYI